MDARSCAPCATPLSLYWSYVCAKRTCARVRTHARTHGLHAACAPPTYFFVRARAHTHTHRLIAKLYQ